MSVLSTPHDEIKYNLYTYISNHIVKTSSWLSKKRILFIGVFKLNLFKIKVSYDTVILSTFCSPLNKML